VDTPKSPIACTLTPEQQRCQAAELLPGLAARARHARWMDDGLLLTFDAASAPLIDIAHVIDRERRCCAFLSFSLHVPSAAEAVELAVRGPDGTVPFLRQLGVSEV
jgi:hypothetical protein